MKHWGLALLLMLGGCKKVPLEEDPGVIDFAMAHWFETEGVAYLFFSLSEHATRLINPQWQFAWTERSDQGGTITHPYETIDFSKGVHEHELVVCGRGHVCGSFSFPSQRPLGGVDIKFLYDADSTLSLEQGVAPQNHAADGTAHAYSALLYGVFDQGNSHVQARVHHNFGEPSDATFAAFGMTRRFRVKQAELREIATVDLAQHRTTVDSPLLFPAAFCNAGAGAGDLTFAGEAGWLTAPLDPADGKRGACFRVEHLRKDGTVLPLGDVAAYARRNPEVRDADSLKLVTPLSTVTTLPLVIAICPDDPSASAMTDKTFFEYQRYILGIPSRPTDLCFKIGAEAKFADEFTALLALRLAAAKAEATTTADFLFKVVLHERFSHEFRLVQASIADALFSLANSEVQAVSPRLVGAFVYGSSVDYQPNASQRSLLLWCPQELALEIQDPNAPLAEQNCTTLPATDLDLQVINFVTPLGPLPSLKQYRKYVDEYGDTGLAKSPELSFASVPTGPNTINEAKDQVTYFDAERYAIGVGENARFCTERADASILGFRVRPVGTPDEVESIPVLEVNPLWLSEAAAGEYRIGIAWEYPFFGAVSYKSALSGKIVSVVPFRRSFRAYEVLGDPKWTTESWDFGRYIQHCYRYCDNPFFDASGTYQASLAWREYGEQTCPASVYPEFPAQPDQGG